MLRSQRWWPMRRIALPARRVLKVSSLQAKRVVRGAASSPLRTPKSGSPMPAKRFQGATQLAIVATVDAIADQGAQRCRGLRPAVRWSGRKCTSGRRPRRAPRWPGWDSSQGNDGSHRSDRRSVCRGAAARWYRFRRENAMILCASATACACRARQRPIAPQIRFSSTGAESENARQAKDSVKCSAAASRCRRSMSCWSRRRIVL
jgi:hypothetical protein